MNMLMWILVSFYFFLPGGIANMAPVLTRKLTFLDWMKKPIDGGRMWRGKPLLGANKTWKGVVMGAVFGMIVGIIQFFLQNSVGWMQLFPYTLGEAMLIGFLLGLGALVGDFVESFFKRRTSRKPGAPWFPFDQLDLVIGGMVFVSIYLVPPWQVWVSLLVCMPIVHFLFNVLGFGLGLQKEWW